jgi:signal transduction histidine kinase/ligand-binding sensor domain-containing protein
MYSRNSIVSFLDVKCYLLTLTFVLTVGFQGCCQIFLRYDKKEGLSNSIVEHINQDRKTGMLLISTRGGGLAKFNGVTFENLVVRKGLSNNNVMSTLADTLGNIWIGTDHGLTLFSHGTYRIFLPTISVKHMALLNTTLYFAPFDSPGVGHIDRQGNMTFLNSLQNERVISLIADEYHQIIWVLSDSGNLHWIQNGTVHTSKAKLKGISSLYVDPRTSKLFVGATDGVFLYDQSTSEFRLLSQEVQNVSQLIHTSQNSLWVISKKKLSRIDENGIKKTFGLQDHFSDAEVSSIFEDLEGNIWVGTLNDGFYKYVDLPFEKIGNKEIEDTDIIALSRLGKEIVLLTPTNLLTYDTEKKILRHLDYGIEHKPVALATNQSGMIWIGTRANGLYQYQFGERTIHYSMNHGLSSDSISCLYYSDSTLWIGTMQGLHTLSSGKIHNTSEEIKEIKNIQQHKGDIQIASSTGIFAFANEKWSQIYYDSLIMPKAYWQGFLDRNSNLWIGTRTTGLIRVDLQSSKQQEINSDKGLSSDFITTMNEDIFGNMVIGTSSGINIISRDQSNTIYDIENFSRFELPLLTNIFVRYRATLPVEDGFWIGTSSGLYKLRSLKRQNIPPKLRITGGWLLSSKGFTRKTISIADDNPTVSYEDRNVVLFYEGVNLTNPTNISYKCRLIGYDDNWSVVDRKEIRYIDLAPGKYSFEVIAANSDGVWNEKPERFTFTVATPFWLRWDFIISSILFLGFILYRTQSWITQRKTKEVLTLEKVRQEQASSIRRDIARDFHDNLGNKLAGIRFYSNLVNSKIEGQKELKELVSYIERNANLLYEGTRDFIWSIDPDNDELMEVYAYVKDFGEGFFDRTDITFRSSSEAFGDSKIILPSGWSKQIVLIFKEAMTNTLKHAEATQATFRLRKVPHGFMFYYSDNGIGFSDIPSTKNFGLKNIHERASTIGAQLTLITKKNEGMEMSLVINPDKQTA